MSVFNPESVTLLQKLSIHSSDVISCDFSKHFYLATGSGDKKVIVCQWKPGLGFVETSYSPLSGHKYSVTCVRFSPTSPILATASVDGHTILWDIKSGKAIHTLVQASGLGVRVVSFTKDGSMLITAGEGGTLCLWAILPHTTSLIRAINGHDDESIQGAAFSPDSQLLVTGDVTGSYRVWSIELMKDNQEASLATVRDAHDLGINCLEFSPNHSMVTNDDGVTEFEFTLFSCGNDHSIVMWSVSYIVGAKASGEKLCTTRTLKRLNGHSSAISQIRISPSGDLISSTSIDKTSRLWDVTKGKCVKILEGHMRYVTSAAFSCDESLLVTGSNDKTIIVWDLSGSLDLSSEICGSQGFHNSNSEDIIHDKKVEQSENVQLLRKLVVHNAAVNSCHFGPSLFISGGSDRKIGLWEWTKEEFNLIRVIDDAHRYSIHQVELSSSEQVFVSASLDGTAIIWDSKLGQIEKSGFHVSGSGVRCARFSPDAELLAVGGDDDTISLYSAPTYDLIGTSTCDDSGATCVAFSPKSDLMVVGTSDGHVHCFSSEPYSSTLACLLENAHDLGVSSLDFAATAHMAHIGDLGEGKYEMVSGGTDCLVKVWNVKRSDKVSITPVWTLSGHGGNITCVRYSPKLAELIASTATDKTCRIWDSYSGDCLHLVESHEGILTCCAFSPDATLLATGSMDKSVLIWRLPRDLAFQLFVSSRVKPIQENEELIADWLERNGVAASDVTSAELLETPIELLLDRLGVADDEERRGQLEELIRALRDEPPDEFICPITHHIMRDPVVAPDGQRYERSAIEAWFGSGEKRSPMTNEEFEDTTLVPDTELRTRIAEYLRE